MKYGEDRIRPAKYTVDQFVCCRLRSNLTHDDPERLWLFYLQLVEVEQAFKELKNDLLVRPIYHQLERRIEAHIFIAFMAYCLQVTLKQYTKALAPGLTPRAVIEKNGLTPDDRRSLANHRWPPCHPVTLHGA